MNDELIFFKTQTGEDAIRERTRLVQRNLRMVLILIDGVVDVATLKHEIGDDAMVDAALTELKRMKLIETVDAHTTRQAPNASLVAPVSSKIQGAAQVVDDSDGIPVLSEVASGTETTGATMSGRSPIFKREPNVGDVSDSDIRPGSDDGPIGRSVAPGSMSTIKRWWQSRKRQRLAQHEEAMFEHAYVVTKTLDPPAVVSPSAKRASRKIRLGSLIWFAVLGATAFGVWQLFFYPYDEYRPAFERRLSRMLDDTVKIGAVRVSLLPRPAISLERISVGATPYAEIAAVRLVPEPWALVGGGNQYHQVVVQGMRIQDSAVTKIVTWFSPASMENISIGQFELSDLSLVLGQGALTGLAGSVQLDQRGLGKLTLRAKEGDFALDAVPSYGGLTVSAAATAWKLPFEPVFVFSKFELNGKLAPGRFAIDKLEGLAYNGQISGSGVISWDRDSTMAVALNLQHIATDQLLPVLGAPVLVEGESTAKISLAANAVSVNRLNEALRLDGTFRVARGSLKRFDLADALRHSDPSTGASRGGRTSFEEFSGTVATDARSVRLGSLRLSSGLMQAGGQVAVSRQSGAITGGASVEMRGSTGTIHAPVTISGNIADPELKAAR